MVKDNPSIWVNELFFEVTRKCNMSCNHCLRGPAQKGDISHKMIDRTLDQVDGIETLVLTGGEPTLNVKSIKYIISEIRRRRIPCYSFFIATNALIYSPDLVLALIDLYAYCMEYSGWDGCERECGLAVSLDKYHQPIQGENILKYQSLKFYSKDKEINGKSTPNIINEGKARMNQLGGDDHIHAKLSVDIIDRNLFKVDRLYIGANGKIVADCDMSYSTQNRLKLGNILSNRLCDIIIGHGNNYVRRQVQDAFYPPTAAVGSNAHVVGIGV